MNKTHLKGLDGLRAICALCLLLGHIPQSDFASWSVCSIPIPVCCAYVFFVISGFLAGYRIDEISSAKSYYKKKAKKLLPLYFSYILFSTLVFIILGYGDEVINPRIWYYLFLVPGVPFCSRSGILPLVHLWFIGSLVLFYMVFPLFAKINKDRAILAAAIIAIIWFIIKLGVRFVLGKESFLYRFTGITCFDILFLGVLGGIAEKSELKLVKTLKKTQINRVFSLFAWALFLFSGFYERFIPAPVRAEFISILSLIIIITQLVPKPIPSIDNTFLNWLSGFSYEFYVIQILLIILLSYFYSCLGLNLPDFLIYLFCIFTVTGCAWLCNRGLLVFRHKSQVHH